MLWRCRCHGTGGEKKLKSCISEVLRPFQRENGLIPGCGPSPPGRPSCAPGGPRLSWRAPCQIHRPTRCASVRSKLPATPCLLKAWILAGVSPLLLQLFQQFVFRPSIRGMNSFCLSAQDVFRFPEENSVILESQFFWGTLPSCFAPLHDFLELFTGHWKTAETFPWLCTSF